MKSVYKILVAFTLTIFCEKLIASESSNRVLIKKHSRIEKIGKIIEKNRLVVTDVIPIILGYVPNKDWVCTKQTPSEPGLYHSLLYYTQNNRLYILAEMSDKNGNIATNGFDPKTLKPINHNFSEIRLKEFCDGRIESRQHKIVKGKSAPGQTRYSIVNKKKLDGQPISLFFLMKPPQLLGEVRIAYSLGSRIVTNNFLKSSPSATIIEDPNGETIQKFAISPSGKTIVTLTNSYLRRWKIKK